MAQEQKTEKRRKKGKAGWIILVLVLAAGALFYIAWRRQDLFSDPAQESGVSYQTKTAALGYISEIAEGSGYVEPASTKAVTFPYDGTLKKLDVETGDQVKAGDVLAEYDENALDDAVDEKKQELSDLNDQIAEASREGSSSITSPVPGRIKRIFAAPGDYVTEVVDHNGGLAEISADGKLKVEFSGDENLCRVSDTVTVEFESYSVSGRVARAEGGEYCVTIDDSTDYQVDTDATVKGASGVVIGRGKLASNLPYLVRAGYGVIDTVEVSRTSGVSAGTTLFTRTDTDYNSTYLDLLSKREDMVSDLQDMQDYQKDPVIKADTDGYIASLDAVEGMTYSKDSQLCTIADESTLNLKVDIDELQIDGVEPGEKAEVTFDAFEDQVFEGTVEKVSGVGKNSGGVTTYTVTLSLEGDARVKDAMSATARITVALKDRALLVPTEAVSAEDGKRYVQVLENGTPVKTEVEVGLINETSAEITGGLSEGAEVILPEMETSDDFIQTMNNNRQAMMNNGGVFGSSGASSGLSASGGNGAGSGEAVNGQ